MGKNPFTRAQRIKAVKTQAKNLGLTVSEAGRTDTGNEEFSDDERTQAEAAAVRSFTKGF